MTAFGFLEQKKLILSENKINPCGKKRMLEYKSLLGYVHPVRENGTLTPLFL
jgi:hypothetical protein